MPSQALQIWLTASRMKLDEFEQVRSRAGVRPSKSGRGYATEQLNHAYLVAVAAQFQRFCRDIHTEATSALASAVPASLQVVFSKSLTRDRRLDRGNAHDGSLGSDFDRIGFPYKTELDAAHASNARRRRKLNQLNTWRNAVVHQDFNFSAEEKHLLMHTRIDLRHVRSWRRNCNLLANEIDRLVGQYVASVVGQPPW